MVPPEVRAMIDEVRSLVILFNSLIILDNLLTQFKETPMSSTSENNESAASSVSSSLTPTMSSERERSSSGPASRLPLALPIPGALLPSQARTQPSLPFERVAESASPHLAHHPKREGLEELASNRLPSITPNGVLIESGSRDTSPNYPRPGASIAHTAAEQFSPPTGSLSGSSDGERYADGLARFDPSPTFRLSESRHPAKPHVSLSSQLTI